LPERAVERSLAQPLPLTAPGEAPLERHRLFDVECFEVSVTRKLLEPRQRLRSGIHARLALPPGVPHIQEVPPLDASVGGVVLRHDATQPSESLFTMSCVLSLMCRTRAGNVTTIAATIEGIRSGLTLRYIKDVHREQNATNLPRFGAVSLYSTMFAAG